MKIMQTTFNKHGSIQIQDHGSAYIVSCPSQEHKGFNIEKVFNKGGGEHAWNNARSFAASQRADMTQRERVLFTVRRRGKGEAS
jgi:hypothetical protein